LDGGADDPGCFPSLDINATPEQVSTDEQPRRQPRWISGVEPPDVAGRGVVASGKRCNIKDVLMGV